jgi:hypothetical protein
VHDHRDVDCGCHAREENAREGQPLGGQHVLQLVLWPLHRKNKKVRMSFLSWSSFEKDTKRASSVCCSWYFGPCIAIRISTHIFLCYRVLVREHEKGEQRKLELGLWPLHRHKIKFAYLFMLPCSFKGIRKGRAALAGAGIMAPASQ